MKAMRFHNYGGPEVLRLDDIPRPVPGRVEMPEEEGFGGFRY